MAENSRKGTRGPMIHVRLDEATHRGLKVHVARTGTTIQQLVEDLIRRQVPQTKRKADGQ